MDIKGQGQDWNIDTVALELCSADHSEEGKWVGSWCMMKATEKSSVETLFSRLFNPTIHSEC